MCALSHINATTRILQHPAIVDEIWKDFTLELAKELPVAECKDILDSIFHSKQIIDRNFEFLFQELKPVQNQVKGPGPH